MVIWTVIWTRFTNIDIVLHLNLFLDKIICVFMWKTHWKGEFTDSKMKMIP